MRHEVARETIPLDTVRLLTRAATHDLNNHVAAILTFSELLLESMPETHAAHADVVEIRAGANAAMVQTREVDRTVTRVATYLASDLVRAVGELERQIAMVLPHVESALRIAADNAEMRGDLDEIHAAALRALLKVKALGIATAAYVS